MVRSSPIADQIERRLRRLFGHGVRHDTQRVAHNRPTSVGHRLTRLQITRTTYKVQKWHEHAKYESNSPLGIFFSERGMVSLHHVTALCVKSENEDVAAEWCAGASAEVMAAPCAKLRRRWSGEQDKGGCYGEEVGEWRG